MFEIELNVWKFNCVYVLKLLLLEYVKYVILKYVLE